MPLIAGNLKNQLKIFIQNSNQTKQTDLDQSIDDFCGKIETLVYEAIKSVTITIPSGLVAVAGTATAQVNPFPIIISAETTIIE